MAKKVGSNPRSIPEGKTQVNFNVPNTIIEKMRAIAHNHKYQNTDVYNQAFETFVNLYEKKHGPVKVIAAKKEIKL